MGDLQRKEEEMRQMFVNKVKETEAELKEKEREVGLKRSYGYRRRSHTLLKLQASKYKDLWLPLVAHYSINLCCLLQITIY